MSRFGNYQSALDELNDFISLGEKVKAETNLIKKFRLYLEFKRLVKKRKENYGKSN